MRALLNLALVAGIIVAVQHQQTPDTPAKAVAPAAVVQEDEATIAARNLSVAGLVAAFVSACPKHWDRLPPRAQRLAQKAVLNLMRDDKDALQKATAEKYADGYDKYGERWCEMTERSLTNAAR